MIFAIVALKFVIFSFIGYLINMFFCKIKKFSSYKLFYGMISPGYGLFSLIGIYSSTKNVLWLLLLGIVVAAILKVIMNLIDKNYFHQINILFWGILNVINVLIINVILDKMLLLIPNFLINFLGYFSLILVLIDMSLSLRKNI